MYDYFMNCLTTAILKEMCLMNHFTETKLNSTVCGDYTWQKALCINILAWKIDLCFLTQNRTVSPGVKSYRACTCSDPVFSTMPLKELFFCETH